MGGRLLPMNSNKKAFTLVELMIVIAVIGILAAMAMPNFRNARNRARQSKCMEYTALLTRTAELYYIENKEYPKDVKSLLPYLSGNKSSIACPAGGVYNIVAGSGSGSGNDLVFMCSLHGCATATWGG